MSTIYFHIDAIKEATHNNHHAEAYILVCECLGERADLLKRNFQSIQDIVSNSGEIHYYLDKYRHCQYESMMKLAKEMMSANEYKLMYSCL